MPKKRPELLSSVELLGNFIVSLLKSQQTSIFEVANLQLGTIEDLLPVDTTSKVKISTSGNSTTINLLCPSYPLPQKTPLLSCATVPSPTEELERFLNLVPDVESGQVVSHRPDSLRRWNASTGMSSEKTSRTDSSSTTATLYSSCPVFNPGDFTHPRPPETDNATALSGTDTMPLSDEMATLTSECSATALLLQMFMSELDSNGKGEGLVGVVTTPTTLVPEVLKQQEVQIPSPAESDSSLAKAITCVKPNSTAGLSSLESIDQTGLDDPFLMDFTDISQLLLNNDTPSLNCTSPSSSSYDRSYTTSPCLTTVNRSPTSSECFDVNSFSTNPPDTTATVECNAGLDLFSLTELVSSDSSPLSTTHSSEYEYHHTTLNFSDELDLEALGITSSDHEQLSELLSSVSPCELSTTAGSQTTPTSTSVQIEATSPLSTTESVLPITLASSEPPTPVMISTTIARDQPASRKRMHPRSTSSSADSDAEDLPSNKKAKTAVKDEKYRQRRDKNNLASQVSRARRKANRVDMSERVTQLETTNAELRRRVEEMTAEAEQLRKLLVERLAHP